MNLSIVKVSSEEGLAGGVRGGRGLSVPGWSDSKEYFGHSVLHLCTPSCVGPVGPLTGWKAAPRSCWLQSEFIQRDTDSEGPSVTGQWQTERLASPFGCLASAALKSGRLLCLFSFYRAGRPWQTHQRKRKFPFTQRRIRGAFGSGCHALWKEMSEGEFHGCLIHFRAVYGLSRQSRSHSLTAHAVARPLISLFSLPATLTIVWEPQYIIHNNICSISAAERTMVETGTVGGWKRPRVCSCRTWNPTKRARKPSATHSFWWGPRLHQPAASWPSRVDVFKSLEQ